MAEKQSEKSKGIISSNIKIMIHKEIQGNIPCADCNTEDNPVWFTDSTLWDNVMKEEVGKILCITCFINRTNERYSGIVSWRLLPHFKLHDRVEH